MSDLAAFMNARLEEDEWITQGAARTDDGHEGHWLPIYFGEGGFDARVDDHIARYDPARVLREIDAKRRRLRRWTEHERLAAERRAEGRPSAATENIRDACWVNVLDDASVYSDHPEYYKGWGP